MNKPLNRKIPKLIVAFLSSKLYFLGAIVKAITFFQTNIIGISNEYRQKNTIKTQTL